MTTTAEIPLTEQPHPAAGAGSVVPCAARPGTGFVHLDAPCQCFVGGPAPEFAPTAHLDLRAG